MEGIDFKRHKDAVAYFNKNYVSTEIFPKEMGKKIGRIKMLREDADYSDFFIVTEKDARAQYETAENVVEEVKKYLENEEVFYDIL